MTQDERATVRGILAALHGYSVSLWEVSPKSYGKLLNSWHDLIADPSATVRDRELRARVDVGGQVILMANLAEDGTYTTYAIQTAIADVQGWGRSWLRREAIPAALLPGTPGEVSELVAGASGIDFTPLNEHLGNALSPAADEGAGAPPAEQPGQQLRQAHSSPSLGGTSQSGVERAAT